MSDRKLLIYCPRDDGDVVVPPFTIQGIEGNGDGFTASAPPKARQAVHVVTVAYRPEEGNTRGDLRRVFRVHTDLPGEPPLDLTATLHVNP